MAHLHRAAMRRSPKMAALVEDLKHALDAPGATGKAVVFSQLRDALAHAEEVLTWEGIGCESVGVRGGGSSGAGSGAAGSNPGEGAIARFRDDPDVKVLLLHAGSAAAGLTLTQADLVVLLEPFLSPGDEAQAANRVHRIGQTRPVRCVTYFVEGTVEERLLAFRTRQSEFGGGSGGGCGGGRRGGRRRPRGRRRARRPAQRHGIGRRGLRPRFRRRGVREDVRADAVRLWHR